MTLLEARLAIFGRLCHPHPVCHNYILIKLDGQ